MSKYFYLDVSLDFDSSEKLEVDAVAFKRYICSAVKTLFGDIGASIDVDLLKYDQGKRRGILRCPAREETAEHTSIAGENRMLLKYPIFPSETAPFAMPKLLTVGKDNKDAVLFVSKSEHTESSYLSFENPDTPKGLYLHNGDINWMCPCLDGMAVGPCGVEFREAFSCYHRSKAEPQGKDCLDKFYSLQDCKQKYPQTYRKEELPKAPKSP